MGYSADLQKLIDAVLADGKITEKERAVLHKKARQEGFDIDELDILIDGQLATMQRETKTAARVAPKAPVTPVPPVTPASKSTSTEPRKVGNVQLCPNCGARIPSGYAVCSECGFAFSGVAANSSVEKLQSQIADFNHKNPMPAPSGCMTFVRIFMPFAVFFTSSNPVFKRKMDLISNFPVPNSRGDLLDFMALVKAQVSSTGPHTGTTIGGSENMSYAYWLLFSNCINKAQVSFSEDPDFQTYFQFYKKEKKKGSGILGWVRCNPKTVGALIFFLLAFIFGNKDGKKHYEPNDDPQEQTSEQSREAEPSFSVPVSIAKPDISWVNTQAVSRDGSKVVRFGGCVEAVSASGVTYERNEDVYELRGSINVKKVKEIERVGEGELEHCIAHVLLLDENGGIVVESNVKNGGNIQLAGVINGDLDLEIPITFKMLTEVPAADPHFATAGDVKASKDDIEQFLSRVKQIRLEISAVQLKENK